MKGSDSAAPMTQYSAQQEILFLLTLLWIKNSGWYGSKKETRYNGVYRVNTDGDVSLITDSITRPNGIGLFPGEQKIAGCIERSG